MSIKSQPSRSFARFLFPGIALILATILLVSAPLFGLPGLVLPILQPDSGGEIEIPIEEAAENFAAHLTIGDLAALENRTNLTVAASRKFTVTEALEDLYECVAGRELTVDVASNGVSPFHGTATISSGGTEVARIPLSISTSPTGSIQADTWFATLDAPVC